MKKYKSEILNNLIHAYERSALYKGTSLNNRKISFKINPKTLKDYFDENNYIKKEEIDQSLRELEELNLIILHWGNGYESHLIKSADLNIRNIEEAYKFLGRKSKESIDKEGISLLLLYINESIPLGNFCREMIEKLKRKESIKKYLDIENIEECKNILESLKYVIVQEEEIFKRNFSIKVFGDSKKFETIEGNVIRILKDFLDEENLSLEEFNILNNPGYVYFKGNAQIKLSNEILNIGELNFGIGISSKDLVNISNIKINANRIITIENLTTFNTFNKKNFLCIYLGGFHNKARRELLKKIKADNMDKEFYHFGDIDCGGFKILKHLRDKTSINFIPYTMDIGTLKDGRKYCKSLTQNDKKILIEMHKDEAYKEFWDIFEYMLKENVKLEQEHLSYG